MREIKFRFWDSQENRFLLGGFVVRPDGYVYSPSNIYKVHQGKLQQSTGLKDKNDVEIYEGDIVRFTRWWFDGEVQESQLIGYIKYSTDEMAYVLTGVASNKLFSNNTDEIAFKDLTINISGCDFEALGNIHENPELLEGV